MAEGTESNRISDTTTEDEVCIDIFASYSDIFASRWEKKEEKNLQEENGPGADLGFGNNYMNEII